MTQNKICWCCVAIQSDMMMLLIRKQTIVLHVHFLAALTCRFRSNCKHAGASWSSWRQNISTSWVPKPKLFHRNKYYSKIHRALRCLTAIFWRPTGFGPSLNAKNDKSKMSCQYLSKTQFTIVLRCTSFFFLISLLYTMNKFENMHINTNLVPLSGGTILITPPQ